MRKLSDFSHIAVIQTAFIGDVALALHLARTVRDAAPDTRLSFITTPVSAPLAAACTAVDEVYAFDKRKKHSGWGGLKAFAAQIRGVDCVITPHRSLRTSLLSRLLKPSFSVGFKKSSLSMLYRARVPYPSHLHEIERNHTLLGVFDDIPAGGPSAPEMKIAPGDMEYIDSLLAEKGIGHEQRIVLLAPGSVWPTKRWKTDYFSETAKRIAQSGFVPVLTGSGADAELCAEVERGSEALNLCTKTSLPQTLALLRRASLIVSNDSAPTHLAGLVQCPVISIFGPTTPVFGFAPRGQGDRVLQNEELACRPCSVHGTKKCPLGTHECMTSVLPEQVHGAALEILS